VLIRWKVKSKKLTLDIINYNVIVRNLTEWTAGNPSLCMDQGTITDGIGNNTVGFSFNSQVGLLNTRANYIQGCAWARDGSTAFDFAVGRGIAGVTSGTPSGVFTTTSLPFLSAAEPAVPSTVPVINVTRRYQVQLALGIMTQEKLIPTKYMASQLAIELTLDTPANCIIASFGTIASTGVAGYAPGAQNLLSYCVSNVNLIPEILEFDSSYDTAFLQGLQNGGVPLKFSSWHTFLFSSALAANVNLLIHERSRSVKSIFTVQRQAQPDITIDNGATFFDTSVLGAGNGGTLQNYQYRVGGRYFPASPVQCSTTTGSKITNGGAEAYTELAKALNILGDYRLSTACNVTRWAYPVGTNGVVRILQNNDYSTSVTSVNPDSSIPFVIPSGPGGDQGSACFAAAISLETSNGVEISGLNAEEQSDISFLATWSDPQVTGALSTPSSLECYVYYDAMIVLEMNNVVKLIQ
jgi:hypothetical protein